MAKSRRRKRSSSQIILWVLSLFLAGSMVISLAIVAFPDRPEATPTLLPSEMAVPPPTIAPSATPLPTPTWPAPTATEPLIGPVLPTASPTVTPTQTIVPSRTPLPTTTPARTVGASPTASPVLTATPSSATLTFTFAICGDSRDNPSVYKKVLDSVASSGSLFLIHAGDMVNSGEESQWQAFRQSMAGFGLPFYPVPGNHDGLGGALDNYLAYSGAKAAHYSFDFGQVHFTLADSHNGGVTAAELEWLRQDLSASRQPVKWVVVHHPPFDPDGTTHTMAFGNQKFMDLMVEQGVDYVVTGHIHAYARATRDGVVYVCTGGAGAPLYGEHPEAYHHYLLVTVGGETVTIEAVKV